jgi:hypothetical protein
MHESVRLLVLLPCGERLVAVIQEPDALGPENVPAPQKETVPTSLITTRTSIDYCIGLRKLRENWAGDWPSLPQLYCHSQDSASRVRRYKPPMLPRSVSLKRPTHQLMPQWLIALPGGVEGEGERGRAEGFFNETSPIAKIMVLQSPRRRRQQLRLPRFAPTASVASLRCPCLARGSSAGRWSPAI